LDPEKKSCRASERVEPARRAWRKLTAAIAPSRWVWVDEFGSHTGLTRTHARAPRGERAHASAPRNHGPNRTTITSLTLEGVGPGLILDEAMTTRGFETYVQHVLAPALQPGQIVGLDNLRQHQSARVRELIEARGASLWFLPTYSPDLNPIEEAFSKVKTLLRSAETRAHETLVAAIWAALAAVTPADAQGYFAHAGYGRAKRRRHCRSRPTGIQRRRAA
jgi:transposase